MRGPILTKMDLAAQSYRTNVDVTQRQNHRIEALAKTNLN